MTLYRTYHPAQVVEVLLEHALKDTKDTVFSDPWVNGRERGFTFSRMSNFDTYVYVAECRNSDRLTLTTCRGDDWAMCTEAEYRKREFFDLDSYQQVCDRVLAILGVERE